MTVHSITDLTDVEQLELSQLVATSLDSGEHLDDIIDQLVSGGIPRDEAGEFVVGVEMEMFASVMADQIDNSSSTESDGSGYEWLLWIGIPIAISILKAIFN